MKHHFMRFLNAERQEFAIFAVCVALSLAAGMFLCKSLLGKMLREDAEGTCSEWVSMVVARYPDTLGLFSGSDLSPQTKNFLDEASQVGDIYRFRVWNASGHLVFNSERMKSAAAPLIGKQGTKALRSGSIINEVHAGSQPQNVPYFVQSFIPVKRNDAIVGVFEIYLDQSDDEILYKRSLLFTEFIIAVLALVAGGVPVYGLYRQMLRLRNSRAETKFLSENDPLTGVPNRRLLNEFAKSALASSRRSQRPVAALMIDMDLFKEINDGFGHAVGDQVLKAAAKRIVSAISDEDLAARFGGDEFVVLQVGMHQPNGAAFLSDNLIRVLSEPYQINDLQLTCRASIGIAISLQDAEDFDSLIACADAALYKAKDEGRNSVRFFESGMDAKARERRRIETEIRRALATDSFQLAYQPFHSLRDGRLLGFEALLRWPEGWPQRSPADFIPVAEETGLINNVGVWVLESACRTAAKWTNQVKVAVNLSPIQFRDEHIASVVKKALKNSGLAPERLELEVTESVWIQESDSVLNQLNQLRRLGVSIALDDFGTGYSSLAYLWKFPFDTVKIDQSFVREMESEPKAAAIVHTITSLGKILNLTITAEGVETPEQARILKEAGCDRAQGYLFGRPLPATSAPVLAVSERIEAKPLLPELAIARQEL